MKKKKLGIILIILTLGVLISGCSKRPVIKIEDIEVSKSELDMHLSIFLNMQQGLKDELKIDEDIARDLIIDSLVDDILVFIHAEEKVTKEHATEMLEIMKTNMSEEEFLAYISSMNVDEDFIIRSFQITETVRKEKDRIRDENNITEEQAMKFFEKNKDNFEELIGERKFRVSHIFLIDEEIAKDVLSLANEETFDDLIKEFSKDISTSETKGDIGLITSYTAYPEIFEALSKYSTEEEIFIYPEIVKTSQGYHILRASEMKLSDFESSEFQVYEMINRENFKNYVNVLRTITDIEINR